MKKYFLFIAFIGVFDGLFAQTHPSSKPKRINKADKSSTQVPEKYLMTHCFITNTAPDPFYFSTSLDSANWKEIQIDGYGSVDVSATELIYLKIWTTKTNYFQLTAYPAHYYKIVFNKNLQKWIFEQ